MNSNNSADPFSDGCPSPIDEGITDGHRDGHARGLLEGHAEGFMEGMNAGRDFGQRIAQLLIPLVRIWRDGDSQPAMRESARVLIQQTTAVSLVNDEDPTREDRISQLETRVKALAANFAAKTKRRVVSQRPASHQQKDFSF